MRQFSLAPRRLLTRCGGLFLFLFLFLFLPELARLHLDALAQAAALPGSRMVPSTHALRCCLALKLQSVERNSHVMPLVADQGWLCHAG
ncbi:hypothetical protein QTI66_38195 [Variovorax sp. J22R133]|uniref:hypothetical protein n=1 Tax=Variovorax brevis TaxID=3053503 RepID=UPI0025761302|nr:hypothetical protein [Variovorax sp. J22R133]MDM0117923.1 hypothetical protein [Variovorax sp. J22R133]